MTNVLGKTGMREEFFSLEQLDAVTEQQRRRCRDAESIGEQLVLMRGRSPRGRRAGDLVTPPTRSRAHAITSRLAADDRALHTVDQCKNGLRAERTRPKGAPPPRPVAVWLGRLRELLQLDPSAPPGLRRKQQERHYRRALRRRARALQWHGRGGGPAAARVLRERREETEKKVGASPGTRGRWGWEG
ncbi:trihelix transcription factor ASIL1-like [Panicum miliaceum]|uniref:Trihelix transcription factor ASIL1-like n=1 Tax=Panicum miliaceum TaxID=4540 RepID=A0A3L6S2M3_PANMI|nr:trihelix transcription factor ASIL1-like [Panicum miliaceum]